MASIRIKQNQHASWRSHLMDYFEEGLSEENGGNAREAHFEDRHFS